MFGLTLDWYYIYWKDINQFKFSKKNNFEVKKVWKVITKGAKLTYDHAECQLKLTLVIQ